MTGRTCPCCGEDRLCGGDEVKQTFPSWRKWGATALLEDADKVCSWCKAVKMADGTWDRLMSVDERAYELSRAGTKTKAEYRDRLGSLPEQESDTGIEDTGKSW